MLNGFTNSNSTIIINETHYNNAQEILKLFDLVYFLDQNVIDRNNKFKNILNLLNPSLPRVSNNILR